MSGSRRGQCVTEYLTVRNGAGVLSQPTLRRGFRLARRLVRAIQARDSSLVKRRCREREEKEARNRFGPSEGSAELRAKWARLHASGEPSDHALK
jgi:hypothetical protein